MRLTYALASILTTFLPLAQSFAATYTCDSCSDCSSKISGATSGDRVELLNDISLNSGSSCVNFGSATNITFDGGSHTVKKGSSGSYGIYRSAATPSGNRIENTHITGFSRGIYIVNGSGTTIDNCTLTENSNAIEVYSSSGNIIENSLIKQNMTGIMIEYNSDNNIIRNNSIIKNHDSGLSFFPRTGSGDPENNLIYNNIFDNGGDGNISIELISTDKDRDLSGITFILTTPLDCDGGANIMGCGCLGGNYWAQPDNQGFSQGCADVDTDGICDTSYTLAHPTAQLVDNLPLTVPEASCCTNGDRDGDGYTAASCGGNDHDDDPLLCGSSCYPGAPEMCDNKDNDNNGVVDDAVACTDTLVEMDAELTRPVADQSCVYTPQNDMFYCFGGRSYGTPSYLDTIESYHPATDQSVVISQKLPTGRSDVSCSYAPTTGKAYCFGGYSQETICTQWNETGGCISAYSIVTRYNDILEFDPIDESLSPLAITLPANLESMGIVWNRQDETIMLFGGTSSIHSGNRDWILEFDPGSETLITLPTAVPSPRYGMSCAPDSSTGKIYCFGGRDSAGAVSEIVEFDPASDTVSPMTSSFSEGIQNTPCVEDSIDNLIYCFGGSSPGTLQRDSIMVFDPQIDSLREQSATFVQGRFGQACSEDPTTNKIYCFGGSRNVVNISEIVEYTGALPVKGDINDSGITDLGDVINTLQILSGQAPAGLTRKADIGGNRQLGAEESIYIMQRLTQ